jgi:hypothetical protein
VVVPMRTTEAARRAWGALEAYETT